MPTYEYQCDACEHRFDELQSFSDKPLNKCPKCGKKKLRRLFGIGAALLFKGAGFYQTDYRSDSYKSAAQADQNAAKASTEKSVTTDKPSTDGAKSTANGAAKASPGKEAKSS